MFGINKKEIKIDTDPQKIEDFLTRGIENIFPSADFLRTKLLRGERVSVYLGIDPTGPTLHLGHIIPILHLAKLQKMGHQIILLMGDITAVIGDPTDKSATRKKLTHSQVMDNLKEYKKQASKFISFDGDNPARFRFNSEWFAKMSMVDCLELASNGTVGQMMKRDMFRKREQEGKEIYVHELLYPLMQGYDSVAMDVDGEIGGNDQTFNMLVGRDMLKNQKNKEKFVIATKLLIDSSGQKMGKTEGNMVALDQSPEDMFGKVMSWDDELIIHGFEIITDVPMDEVRKMGDDLTAGKNPKDFKIKLAKEIVKMCHSEKAADNAEKSWNKTFSQGGVPEDVLTMTVAPDVFLCDILLAEKIVESKTDWRRLVEAGAVTNMTTGQKVCDDKIRAESGVYKIGKRRFVKVVN
jgi:tyrosyl-tRNA synthetase